MLYKIGKMYQVKIVVVDETSDTFNFKGEDMESFRDKIFVRGYARQIKPGVQKIITPFAIAEIIITEK